MAHTVAQRLAIVETKIGVIADQQAAMAQDLVIVRDYVVSEQAKRALFRRVGAVIVGVLTGAAAFVKVFSVFRGA